MKHYAIIITILALGAVTLRAQDTTVRVPALPRPEPLPVLFQKHRPVNDYSGLRSLLRRLAHPKWDGRAAEPDTLEYLPSFEALRDAGEPMTREELSEALMPATRFARNMDKAFSDADGSVKDHFLSMARGETPVGPPVYVFFRIGTARLTDESQGVNIDAVAGMASSLGLHVRITGAADSAPGTAAKNEALALARAGQIASLLRQKGVPEDRIAIASEGGTAALKPQAANRNCRIELFLK